MQRRCHNGAELVSEPETSSEEIDLGKEHSNSWFDEVSARPSSLPELTISLTGFSQENVAQKLGETIQGF